MRLHGMSNSGFEDFLKNLEGTIACMPDACVSMQNGSDGVAVCGELWNELREPLATWMSPTDFVARVHEVCDRATSHYVGVARAQLIEQLAGMRAFGRVCCARPSEQSGVVLVQQTVQDEAFMRTVTNPCAVLKEEMKAPGERLHLVLRGCILGGGLGLGLGTLGTLDRLRRRRLLRVWVFGLD